MLASDGIGLSLKTVKTLESLKVEKWLIHSMTVLVKLLQELLIR